MPNVFQGNTTQMVMVMNIYCSSIFEIMFCYLGVWYSTMVFGHSSSSWNGCWAYGDEILYLRVAEVTSLKLYSILFCTASYPFPLIKHTFTKIHTWKVFVGRFDQHNAVYITHVLTKPELSSLTQTNCLLLYSDQYHDIEQLVIM